MRKLITPTLFFLAISLTAQSPVRVIVNIVHFVGTDTCAAFVTGQNDQQENFRFNRIQYYMDDFELVHDNGQVDTSNAIALVNGLDRKSWVDLGMKTLTSLESLRFGIGVNSAQNHLDPTAYPASHPLAPQNPSMHWGWTSGYRFVAAEGPSGSSLPLNKNYEFHCLGDQNYWMQTIPTSGTLQGDTMIVTIHADYGKLFEGISVGSGPIIHSTSGDAINVMVNLNTEVFTSATGAASVSTHEHSRQMTRIYPNPSQGDIIIETPEKGEMTIYNVLGEIIHSSTVRPGANSIHLDEVGLHMVVVQCESTRKVERVLVQ